MSDIQSLIQKLQSDNPNKRYDAREELRVTSSLPTEALEALKLATNDSNSDVADAAQRALALHIQVNNDKVISNQESITKSQPTTPPKDNLGITMGIGLLVGFIGTIFLVNLMTYGNGGMFYLVNGVIGGIFGAIGSVIGFRKKESLSGALIGAIIGTLIVPVYWCLSVIGLRG